MDFQRLYLTSDGLINRKVWWMGTIGLVLIAFFASFTLGLVISVIGLGQSRLALSLVSLLVMIGSLYLFYNISVKRLRDRGRPLALALVFIIPGIIIQALQVIGLTGSYQMQEFLGQQMEMFTPNAFGMILGWINMGIGLWSLIELGVLPGRQGAEPEFEATPPSDL